MHYSALLNSIRKSCGSILTGVSVGGHPHDVAEEGERDRPLVADQVDAHLRKEETGDNEGAVEHG